MPSAPAIGFEYRPSRLLRRALSGVVALALLCIGLSALPLYAEALLAAVVLVATWRALRQMARGPIVAAGWDADQQWTLHLSSHDDVAATLLSFRALGAFVLLRLRAPGLGVQTLLLGPDNSDADIRRRLRMRLATMQADEALPRL